MALLMIAAPAPADEVYLLDGSKLVGTVTQIAGGKLTIKTEFAADPITLDMAKVKGITSAAPINVQVESGERAIGKLQYDAANNQQQVTGDLVGVKAIEVGKVTSVWPQGAEDPALLAARAETEAQKPKWSVRVEAGLNGQTGNSEKFALNGGFTVKRTSPTDRFSVYGTARYSIDNGVRTSNEFIGGTLFETDLTPNLFWFVRGELETDEFESLDLRATALTGIGLFVIREKETEFKLRAGVGIKHESFDNGTNQTQGLLELGEEFRKEITPWLLFTHSITYYPTLDDAGDFRIVMVNAAEIPLTNDKAWKLRLGIKNEFDNQPQPGVSRLDTYYFANIVVDY
ncbi:MAG: DUF481 domain-containing protein [Phycisphaeraceae bacterium]